VKRLDDNDQSAGQLILPPKAAYWLTKSLKFIFVSISFMGVLPLDASHVRKRTLTGALDFQNGFWRKVGKI